MIIYIIFNTKIEKLKEKRTIFTILNGVPSMVVESPVCRELLRANPLLIRAFTYFTLNAYEYQLRMAKKSTYMADIEEGFGPMGNRDRDFKYPHVK